MILEQSGPTIFPQFDLKENTKIKKEKQTASRKNITETLCIKEQLKIYHIVSC